jgi:hypothetical protein
MNDSNHAHARREVVGSQIEFLRPIDGKPYIYEYEPTVNEPPQTAVFDARQVLIHDARKLSGLSLDQQGAILIKQRSDVKDFYDETEVVEFYYPEASALIRRHTGAERVIVFDHNVRRGNSMSLRTIKYAQGRPVSHAHTDYTEVSAVRRLQEVLGEDSALGQRPRVLQVNLWRPITGPVRDMPLAICDAGSIAQDQLVPVDLLYPSRRGEVYYLTYDPGQRWYYAPDMQPDEAWLLKNYDSATGIARFTAHSAFSDPTPRSYIPPRESIEVRAFAIF